MNRTHGKTRRSRRRATVAVILGVALLGVLDTSSASAETYIDATFSGLNCSTWTAVTAPTGTTQVWFTIIGGGGAGGDSDDASGGSGGQGALVTGSITIGAGQVLWAKAGCGGLDGAGNAPGYNPGGDARGSGGGGGGASTALCLGTSAAQCGGGAILAIAGGGGGGGAASGAPCVGGSDNGGGSGGSANGGGVSSGGTSGESGGYGYGGARGANGAGGNYGRGGGGAGGTGQGPGQDTGTNPGNGVAGAAGYSGSTSNGNGGTTATGGNAASVSGGLPTLAPGTGGQGGAGGGNNGKDGGGGGGGFAGGGGGGGGRYQPDWCGGSWDGAAGGGAGSSWVKSTISSSTFGTAGGTTSCSSTVQESNAGYGGSSGVCGRPGYAKVTWRISSTATSFSVQPSSTAIAGVAFAQQPIVQALAGSTGVANESITLRYTGASTGVLSCSANPVTTDSTGKAVFSGCYLPSVGTYNLTATNNASGAVATSNSITISENNTWSGHTVNFTNCGSYTYTLPTMTKTISATAKGAGGGAGGVDYARDSDGGNGALASIPAFSALNGGVLRGSTITGTVGCGGGGGGSSDTSGAVAGGTGGSGFGNGANGGTVASGGSRRKLGGGGGGGGTSVCFSTCTNVSTGVPLLVAGGGGGGGGNFNYGNDNSNDGPDGGGNGTGAAFSSRQYYGSGPFGNGWGGPGGRRGDCGAGGGGGGDAGAAGAGAGCSSAAGSGGSGPVGGGGGQGYDDGYGGTGTGGISTGGLGGVGEAGRDTGSRSASGGGGGGGFYGGGGGGGDDGSNVGGGGGGSGSSWGNTELGVTPTHTVNGGGTGGTDRATRDVAGNPGANGSVSLTLSGDAISFTAPTNQTSQVGTAGLSYPMGALVAYNPVDNRIVCCAYTATGLPSGWTINPSTGVIAGTAPTAVGVYSISVTVSTTSNTFLTSPAQFSVSRTFTWTFNPGPANKVVVTTQPSNPTRVATNFGITGQVQDQYGNLRPDYVSPVSIAITSGGPGGVTLQGTTTVNAVGGNVTVTGLHIDQTGFLYQLTLTTGSLVPVSASRTIEFDVVQFAASGGQVLLSNQTVDPVLDEGTPAASNPGSGVASTSYYYCSGYSNATPCTASNGTFIHEVTTGPDYEWMWTAPTLAGSYRVVSVPKDNVGNVGAASASTPIKVG